MQDDLTVKDLDGSGGRDTEFRKDRFRTVFQGRIDSCIYRGCVCHSHSPSFQEQYITDCLQMQAIIDSMVEYSEDLTEEQIAEINAQTVDAGDRALISVQPFSAETLTVTMKNGEVFTINITDTIGKDGIILCARKV